MDQIQRCWERYDGDIFWPDCHQHTSSPTSVTNKKALYTLIELYISEIRYNIYNLIKLLDQNKPQL